MCLALSVLLTFPFIYLINGTYSSSNPLRWFAASQALGESVAYRCVQLKVNETVISGVEQSDNYSQIRRPFKFVNVADVCDIYSQQTPNGKTQT